MKITGKVILQIYCKLSGELKKASDDDKKHFEDRFTEWLSRVEQSISLNSFEEFAKNTRLSYRTSYYGKRTRALLIALGINSLPNTKKELYQIVKEKINEPPKDKRIYNIVIPMTDRDCYDILEGNEFNWTFPDENNNNISVNVHLKQETQKDVDE